MNEAINKLNEELLYKYFVDATSAEKTKLVTLNHEIFLLMLDNKITIEEVTTKYNALVQDMASNT